MNIELLDRLDRSKWDQIHTAMNVISAVHRGLHIHLRISLDDFEDEVRIAKRLLRVAPKLDETSKFRLLNRALNLTVALRIYEEHALSVLRRNWGADAPEVEDARELFAHMFDESFAYRVLYALRNALVHSTGKLLTLKWSSRLVDRDAEESVIESNVVVGLSRTAFAESDARPATRREVQALAEDPDILELSRDAVVRIEMLNQALEPLLHPKIEDAVLCVWDAVKNRFPTANEAPWFVVVDGNTNPTSILSVPATEWDYIVRRGQHVAALAAVQDPESRQPRSLDAFRIAN